MWHFLVMGASRHFLGGAALQHFGGGPGATAPLAPYKNHHCLKHLQLFIAVFNEKVKNIERSKASISQVRSCLDAVKSTIKRAKSTCSYQRKLNQS